MLGAQLVTRRLYPAFGPRRVIAVGLIVVAASVALMGTVGLATNLWWMRTLMFLMGVGMSGVFVPAQAAAFATVSSSATGRASTLFNALRQLGGAIGVALLTTVVALVGPTRMVHGIVRPDLSSYHLAFLVAAAVALIASVSAWSISDVAAAPTIRRRTGREVDLAHDG
jgi:MFS family permease